MMANKISATIVILSGGSGKRLWPLSREGYPKQFIKLFNNKSLFQGTVERFNKIKDNSLFFLNKIIVANEQHRFLVQDQISETGKLSNFKILLEPFAKNTAAAITFSALEILDSNTDSVMVVSPSDHIIKNQNKFNLVISRAIKYANQGGFVIVGVSPKHPSNNFGYIKFIKSNATFKDVLKFTEKPSIKKATSYVSSDQYFWNSGIFIFKASAWLNALKKLRPDILEACKKACLQTSKDGVFVRPNPGLYLKIPSESIDYAVMENINKLNIPIKTIRLDSDWDDLGSWESISSYFKLDSNRNATKGDTYLYNSFDNIVLSEKKLVCTSDIKNLIIIDTPDALLVSKKDNSNSIKKLVSHLELQKRSEVTTSSRVFRPWGWYETVLEGKDFKVKRIYVKPFHSLSLQKHKYRAEHWVVVSGKAEVTNNLEVKILKTNESAFIKKGSLHRLANSFNVALEIIEVQTGNYLNENDIVRIEDKYGR